MRFSSLTLTAFGPFTGQHLDLSAGGPGGLHLIFGQNEAGKSTSLRAVSALLFGMPHQTGDAHLHPSSDLRVSAVIESEGRELFVTRVKRKKDSLLDRAGEPLAEDTLVPVLQGLDQTTFETRFGLDQNVLEQGAEALLGGSEEGLFAAGTAGVGVASVLHGLEEEMAAIFRPRGQKYRLNAALVRLAEAEKALRFSERPPEKYQEQKSAHDHALSEVTRLETEQHRTRRELGRLSRLASVLTEVSRWLDGERELDSLSDVPLLPPDAERRRQEMFAELRESELEAKSHEAELLRLERALVALPAPSGLADAPEDRLALIRNQIGSELKSRADLPKRQAKLLALADEVDRLKRQIGRPDAEPDELQVDAPFERTIRGLIADHARIVLLLGQLERTLAQVALDRQELGESPGVSLADLQAELADNKARLRRAREELAVTSRIEPLELQLAQLKQAAQSLLVELAPVAEIKPIDADELDELLERRREVERRILGAQKLSVETEALVQAAESKARVLRDALEVPSEEDLVLARTRRDDAVARLASARDDERSQVASEVRARIEQADGLADRLRREAARVSELASLLLQTEDARHGLRSAEGELSAALVDRVEWKRSYSDLFARAGLAPPPPEQARALARRVAQAVQAMEELARLGSELQFLSQKRNDLLAQLRPLVPGQTGDAALLITLLDERIGALQEDVVSRQGRERQQAKLVRREREEGEALERARAELRSWSERWERAMQALGRAPDAAPSEIEAYLSALGLLAAKAAELREMQRRIDGMDRDTRSFHELLSGVARVHAPDLLQGDPVVAAEALLARARETAEHERERSRLSREIKERKGRCVEAHQRKLAAEAELAELVRDARVSSPADLAERIERSSRKRELVGQQAELKEILRSRSGGRSLEELVTEVRGLDHDELRATIAALESRQEEVDQELRLAQRDAVELGRGLSRYASEEAADARQRVSERRAAVSRELQEYLVRKAAVLLLRGEMERYARQNQGPILERAREHFARLTLGRYTGLRVGLGQRTLWCVRDGKDVEVQGLSRGTRAQLYFALRIASLERHFERHGPIPLLLDDLFVDFDDDRAAAAFELLGEVAQKTQILYYTHLARDVEAADSAVPKARLVLHKLGVV